MHLGTLRTPNGGTSAAVLDGAEWVLLDAGDAGALIADPAWRETAEAALGEPDRERVAAAEAELAVPVPEPRKILCCGLNYLDHIAEAGRDVPEYPTLFAKFADTLTDPLADVRVVGSERVDWEAELAVVVGAPVRRATRSEAEDAILGYTVANDISCRDWQSRTLQWLQGKAWDRTTPIGPVIVTADEISPKEGLEIVAEIDGVTMQRSNTRELAFDAADLVAYISQFTELGPGDIVLTGTPGGVGLGMSPQRWLRDGEVLTTRIEGIGELRNTMRIAAGSTEEEQ